MKDDSDKCKHVFKSKWYGDECHYECKKCGAMKVLHLGLGIIRDDTKPKPTPEPKKPAKKKWFFR